VTKSRTEIPPLVNKRRLEKMIRHTAEHVKVLYFSGTSKKEAEGKLISVDPNGIVLAPQDSKPAYTIYIPFLGDNAAITQISGGKNKVSILYKNNLEAFELRTA